MSEQDRDILIEVRADMKHVREGVDHLKASDTKQWEKLDSHSEKIATHDVIIKWVGGIGSAVIAGILIWFLTTRGHS